MYIHIRLMASGYQLYVNIPTDLNTSWVNKKCSIFASNLTHLLHLVQIFIVKTNLPEAVLQLKAIMKGRGDADNSLTLETVQILSWPHPTTFTQIIPFLELCVVRGGRCSCSQQPESFQCLTTFLVTPTSLCQGFSLQSHIFNLISLTSFFKIYWKK